MKIWYQSASRYRYHSSRDEYGKALEEQCRRAARPDTEVYVTGVPESVPGFEKYKSLFYYHVSQFINNYLKAEKEGYDAIAIGCSLDGGLAEAREMLSIPVVGIAQANFHMAAMLGELFAVVTTEPYIAEKYRQMIVGYGLSHKHLRNYVFNVPEGEVIKALNDPEPIAKKFQSAAEQAVADGASVIIPVPAPIFQAFYRANGPMNIGGAIILDPVAVLVKTAEMLVDLKKVGMEVSRKPGIFASPGKELLQQTFTTYAKVFKIER